MLITLTSSSSDGSAMDFVNYFKESVQIEPGSELALVQTVINFTTRPTETPMIAVNIDQFSIRSMFGNSIGGSTQAQSGGVQKVVGVIPYGNPTGGAQDTGQFVDTKDYPIYHSLENQGVENHNQLRIRLTDSRGAPISNLVHPTIITLDIRPRMK